MNVERSHQGEARKLVEQDRHVVGYSPEGMPLNAAGRIVLTPMMRLEGYHLMDDGSIAKKSRRGRLNPLPAGDGSVRSDHRALDEAVA
jgi:hypothetical protein